MPAGSWVANVARRKISMVFISVNQALRLKGGCHPHATVLRDSLRKLSLSRPSVKQCKRLSNRGLGWPQARLHASEILCGCLGGVRSWVPRKPRRKAKRWEVVGDRETNSIIFHFVRRISRGQSYVWWEARQQIWNRHETFYGWRGLYACSARTFYNSMTIEVGRTAKMAA